MTLPFSPTGNSTNLTVGTGTSSVALPSGGTSVGGTMRIANVGSNSVFLSFGSSTVTASLTTSMKMLPNTVEVFAVLPGAYVAAIATATGNTINITPGVGE